MRLSVSAPLPLVLLMLAMVGAAATAAAQGETTEVWERETRVIDEDLTIANGTTLHVRGSSVIFAGVNVTVEEEGRLIVESLADAPARLTSGDKGWTMIARGHVEVRGLPEAPVTIEGLGGTAGLASGATAFDGGITFVGANATLEHVHFSNYTSGLLAGAQTRLSLDNLRFESDSGAGLVVTMSHFNATNVSFRGVGAVLFATVSASPIHLQNLSFQDTGTALTLRELKGTVEDITVTNSTVCVSVIGSVLANLKLSDVTCNDFGLAGLYVQPATPRPDSRIELEVERLQAWSEAEPRAAVFVEAPHGNVTLRDSLIGPANAEGVYSKGVVPVLDNVTFTGVSRHNVYLMNPASEPSREPPGKGEAGGMGWQLVSQHVLMRVVDRHDEPVPTARVSVFGEANGTRVLELDVDEHGSTGRIVLQSERIDRDGRHENVTYRIEAHDTRTGKQLVVHGYQPDARMATLRFTTDLDAKSTPLPTLLPLIGAGIALIVLRRRPA